MAGVSVFMRGVWVETAGEVLCGNVGARWMGDMGVGSVMVGDFIEDAYGRARQALVLVLGAGT